MDHTYGISGIAPARYLIGYAHLLTGTDFSGYQILVFQAQERGKFVGKIIFMFFKLAVGMDNAPHRFHQPHFLLPVELLIYQIGKLPEIDGLAAFAICQCKQFFSLFLGDGVWDGGPFGRYEGRTAIEEFFRKAPELISFANHYVTNPIIEVDVSEFRKLDGGLSCLSLRF